MSENNDSRSYEIRFVIPEGGLEKTTEIMKAAFGAMQSNSFDPLWITETECLQLTEQPSKLFIIDPFEGKAYKHLVSLKCRILGPLCILECIQTNQSLPYRSYPVYSVSMRKVIVTTSNVDKKVREEISKKIELMGGYFNKDLTKSVTHLVVGSVSSTKYNVAVSFGLPIMKIDWIHDCWDNGQYQQIHATNEIYKKYLCPPFYGLSVTVSQLTNEERKNIQQCIEKNGGKYSGAMRAKEVTHLILMEPKGEKYKFAKAWKIKCVKLNWLYDSLNAGFCKDEKLYQLDDGSVQNIYTSTPEKGNLIEKMKNINCSTIYDNTISCLESRLEETTNINSVTIAPANNSFNILDEFNDILKVGQFLDGCRIYVSGFSGLRLEKLYKIINAGGGMRFNKLNESVTHSVLGEKDDNILRFIEEKGMKCHVVSYLWLVNCYKEHTLLDEEPYRYIKNITLSPQISSKIESVEHLASHHNETQQPNNCRNISTNIDNSFSDIINQYLPSDDDKTIKSDKLKSENRNKSEMQFFSEFTAHISGFQPKDSMLLSEMFQSAGGKIAKVNSKADLHIVPLIGTSVNFSAVNIVTNYWIQMCIEKEKLLQFDFHPLCKPLNINSEILKGCVISFSQYTGAERDGLMELAENMGSCTQECFVRKANKKHGLLPNTHLIVAVSEGSKYEASKKWNIPAVTKEWLFECIKMGKRVNEVDYLLDLQESVSKYDKTSITVTRSILENNQLVNTLIDANQKEIDSKDDISVIEQDNDIISNPVQDKKLEEPIQKNNIIKSLNITNESSTSSKFLDSNEVYHPDYEVNSVLSMLNSPINSDSKDRKKSLPIQDLFAEKISAALRTIGVEDLDKTGSDCEQDKNNNKPLKGVVLCVSKKLSNKQGELNKIVHSLGGNFRWSYSSDCTHFVYQGKSSSARDFKTAQEQGKKIVSIEWIYACRDAHALVDESQFSPTYNPRLSLLGQISVKKLNCQDEKTSKRLSYPNNPNQVELDIKKDVVDGESKALNNFTPEQENEKDISRELEELLNASKRKTENIHSSPSPNSKQINFNVYNHNLKKQVHVSEKERINKINKNIWENKNEVLPLEAFTQSVPITWDDPTGRSEREKLADHINQANLGTESFSPPSINVGNETKNSDENETFARTVHMKNPSDDNSINNLQHNPDEQIIQNKRFMFSGFTENEKAHYSEILRNIGGIVLDTRTFDNTTTHLILGQPLKNEKFLASVASGLWVLHKSYVESCAQAGCFVDEEIYEWGGTTTQTFEYALQEKYNKVAMCPRRWRIKISKQNKLDRYGAFREWKVLIIADKQKSSTYKRILESGGAEIIKPEEDMNNVTHAFIEVSKEELNKVDLESLVSSGVNCLKPEYIAFYLVEINPPSEEKFLIPQVKQLLEKHANKKRKLEGSEQPNKKYQYER
ncbi:DNA topoisomerase 2-binding protein 1-A-like isoform X2 [Centruroides sculpturatus]|nr:DNA topoisomerase 2-binding protein 1-A-like isoform X2 [Centruroides sculpturatus]